jgi:hypothetical protein
MAIVAGWLPLLGMPMRRWLDFSAFYAGGALIFTPHLIDLAEVEGFQFAEHLPNTPFLYPPGLAILYAPLTALPYDVAAAVHVVVQAAALGAAAWLGAAVFGLDRRWTILGAFAWAPAAGAVISGQNSAALLLLLVIAAWAMSRGATGLAGLATGLGAYRPHVGLPIFGLVIWRRAWLSALVAASVFTGHYLLGVAATGGLLDWPIRWVKLIAAETAIDFTSVGWQVIGLPGILGRLSIAGSAPGAILGPALVGYAIGLVLIVSALGALRSWDTPRAIALTCSLALFAGPRGFAYDATLLLPAVAVLARDATDRGWPWQDRWLLAAAYGIALIWPVAGLIGLNPLAILVIAAPFALLGRWPFRRLRPVPVGILARP